MIFEKVVHVLSDYVDVSPEEIKQDSTLEELEFDSLDVVEIVMALEDEFGVSVELTDDFVTVGDVVEFIEDNM